MIYTKPVNDRILEAEVAIKVMGWHLVEGTTWRDAEGKYRGMTYIWCPSVSIADAWEVVEKMREGGNFDFELQELGAPAWEAVFLPCGAIGVVGIGRAPTAPEAICRAALAALEK